MTDAVETTDKKQSISQLRKKLTDNEQRLVMYMYVSKNCRESLPNGPCKWFGGPCFHSARDKPPKAMNSKFLRALEPFCPFT